MVSRHRDLRGVARRRAGRWCRGNARFLYDWAVGALSGQHDDQAVAVALGTYWLLGWWCEGWGVYLVMRRLAEQVSSEDPAAAAASRPRSALSPAPEPAAAAVGSYQDSPLEGVVFDAVARRKLARDAAYRDHHGPVLFGYLPGG